MNENEMKLIDEQLRLTHQQFNADHDALRDQVMLEIEQLSANQIVNQHPPARIRWTWARFGVAAAIAISFTLGFTAAKMTGSNESVPANDVMTRPAKIVEVVLVQSPVAEPFVFTEKQEDYKVDIRTIN